MLEGLQNFGGGLNTSPSVRHCLQGDSFLEGVGSKHLRMFSETQRRLSKSSDPTGLSLIQTQSSTVHFQARCKIAKSDY